MQVEDCLQAPNALASLMDLYQANVQQLAELSEVVGADLNDVERRIMIALITIDVHNRWSIVTVVMCINTMTLWIDSRLLPQETLEIAGIEFTFLVFAMMCETSNCIEKHDMGQWA